MKVLQKNGEFVEMNFKQQEGKKAFWHSAAHILAQAVESLYPDTKCAVGAANENGFYYDFEFSFPFSEANLSEVEEIQGIVGASEEARSRKRGKGKRAKEVAGRQRTTCRREQKHQSKDG